MLRVNILTQIVTFQMEYLITSLMLDNIMSKSMGESKTAALTPSQSAYKSFISLNIQSEMYDSLVFTAVSQKHISKYIVQMTKFRTGQAIKNEPGLGRIPGSSQALRMNFFSSYLALLVLVNPPTPGCVRDSVVQCWW